MFSNFFVFFLKPAKILFLEKKSNGISFQTQDLMQISHLKHILNIKQLNPPLISHPVLDLERPAKIGISWTPKFTKFLVSQYFFHIFPSQKEYLRIPFLKSLCLKDIIVLICVCANNEAVFPENFKHSVVSVWVFGDATRILSSLFMNNKSSLPCVFWYNLSTNYMQGTFMGKLKQNLVEIKWLLMTFNLLAE